MKYARSLILFLFCGALLFTSGCGQGQKTKSSGTSAAANLFSSSESSSDIDDLTKVSMGINIDSNGSYTYTGKPVTCHYTLTYESSYKQYPFGVMLFMNGIAQPFTLDGNGKKDYLQTFSMSSTKSGKSRTLSLTFTPVNGQIDQENTFVVALLHNPNFMPAKGSTRFVNRQIIDMPFFEFLRSGITFTTNAPSNTLKAQSGFTTETITNDLLSHFGLESDSNDSDMQKYEEGLKKTLEFPQVQMFPDSDFSSKFSEIKAIKGEKLKLSVHSVGGATAGNDVKCRTTIFIDNEPVKTTDGYDYLESTLQNNKVTEQTATIDLSGLSAGRHSIYAIMVPYSGFHLMPNSKVYSESSQSAKSFSRLLTIS